MRVALTPVLPSELIDYILKQTAYPSTLIVCQPYADFVEALCNCYPVVNGVEEHESIVLDTYWETLNQIMVSRHVTVLFIPTVSHLRAVLTNISLTSLSKTAVPHLEAEGRQPPKIIVYGFVKLHEDTSQWSAQGLGNSMSALIDAGLQTKRDLIVVEERGNNYRESEDFLANDRATRKNMRICHAWQQQLPLLSGNERRDGISGDAGYSGRTVETARILGRWFKFEEGSWVDDGE
ncbi:hypothetical protein BJ878DRAFT_502513 [Calycina marina]|uniref:Uncharacterized protein n=1 Tax=Calycina marina TaxID=1763456 RepID=A0A9P7Z4W9_9HELO|nr:hypothetical protein BJ878DRAFT_502513 [Calycina marina]